jgi:multidrug efflux pump subunit AcrA (membrane-fusion protein)
MRPESDGRKQKEQAQEQQRREQKDRKRRKEKKQEQERKEKEQEQREEAREQMRRKAQQQREERERQAREQDVRERRQWQQAWQSYVTKWAAFKEAKHEPSDHRQARLLIPWPVKSGRYGDLQASNVKAFYRKACPDAETSTMYKTMQAESLKWHPDKMCKLFPTCTPGDADKQVIDIICKVVLELRQGAKALRAG